MPLTAGQQLLHYRLVDPLGEGGMGVVWRAVDTTLDREVAIKVLPDAVAGDADRLARFDREARLLASLNHPHIAGVYGLHEAGGVRFLAMELVAGEDLSTRLARGPLPVDEALRIAREVAEALEAAHERGIVHRDLKPGNVRLAADGQAKVLDFGLAKGIDAAPDADIARSPTLTAAGTVAGLVLGTAAYMAPEQAAGQPIDRRCDIWSFGVMLHEMLTGRRLFAAETVSHTLADVLRAPIEIGALPAATPAAVRRLIERCLVRDRKRRLRDIGEARIALEDALADPRPEAPRAAAPRSSRLPWAVALTASITLLLALAALLANRRSAPAAAAPTLRFSIEMPNETGRRQGDGVHIALSPDGRTIATVGGLGAEQGIHLRSLDRFESRKLEGTTGARRPVFSPDGAWIAFMVGADLMKIRLHGGPATDLGRLAASTAGISWGTDGFLYFSEQGKIHRIPEGGGEIEVLDPESKLRLNFPSLLPGGKTLLCSTPQVSTRAGRLMVLDLASREARDLGLAGSDPTYLPTGHLLFVQGTDLYLAPFDLERLAITGAPVPALPGVWVDGGEMQLAVSAEGTVAYLPVGPAGAVHRLMSVTLDGKATPLLAGNLPFRTLGDPRFSHDGRRLLLAADNSAIWMLDLDTETPTLLSESGFYPYWSPTDREIVFSTARNDSFDIYRRPVDLSRPEELLLDIDNNLRTADWTRQGTLVLREEIAGKGMDLRILTDVDDPASVRPLLEGADNELAPNVSADGRWLAFVSDYSGSDEVYVTSFPAAGGRIQISTKGGNSPVWAPDGRTLYYFEDAALVAASVETAPRFRVTGRRTVVEGAFLTYRWSRMYDIDPSGKRFVMIQTPALGNVQVVTHWFAELQ